MFCPRCGNKIPDNSIFCSFCGAKLSDEENVTTSSEQPSEVIDVPVLGSVIRYQESVLYYIYLRNIFEDSARNVATNLSDTLYSRYKDMDDFVRRFPSHFQQTFENAIDCMNSLLAEQDLYGVTIEEIEPYADEYCYHTWKQIQIITEKYQAILDEQEGMKEYRQARKNSRGKLVGGGFGLQGAVRGIATAGAVNMTTGALHSVGNAIGNMGSAISAINAKEKLFKSALVRNVSDAVYDDILNIHLIAIDILMAHGSERCRKYTEEDDRQANKIQNDLERGIISADRKREATVRMLMTFPFNPDYYRTAIKLFPEEVESLREFAEFFELDIDVFYDEFQDVLDPAVDILLNYRTGFTSLLLDDLALGSNMVKPLTTDLEEMLSYIESIFQMCQEKGFTFLPSSDNKKLQNAKATYASYGKEIPLLLYDSTLGGSAKEGFLITDKRIYISVHKKEYKVRLQNVLLDIRQESDSNNNCQYLYFGEQRAFLLNSGCIIKSEVLVDFIEFVIALILFLSNIQPRERDLWQAIARYKTLPPSKKKKNRVQNHNSYTEPNPDVCYCFDCGAENVAGDKFCCECGAELI